MEEVDLTLVIIGITVWLSYSAWRDGSKMYRWIFNPVAVLRKRQYHRLISSGFIHADTTHLAFNMITLFFFGRYLEQVFIGGFYLLALAFSSLPALIKHKDNVAYNALGASGAVSAVLFFYILTAPWGILKLFFVIPIPAIIFGVLYIIFSYRMGQRNTDNIGHEAHLFGALFGFFIPLIIEPALGRYFIEALLAGPQEPLW